MLVKLQTETCNFTRSITTPSVLFTVFNILQTVSNLVPVFSKNTGTQWIAKLIGNGFA